VNPRTRIGYLAGLEAHYLDLQVRVRAHGTMDGQRSVVGYDHVTVGVREGPQVDVAVCQTADGREFATFAWLEPKTVVGVFSLQVPAPDKVDESVWRPVRIVVRQALLSFAMGAAWPVGGPVAEPTEGA
jgi:hypothetical protein